MASQTDEKLDQMVAHFFKEGLSDSEMAEALGVSSEKVKYRRHKLKLVKPQKVLSEADEAEIIHLRSQKMSKQKIARQCGVAISTIDRVLASQQPSSIELMLKKPANRFLILPWTKGSQIGTVFSAESPVL